MDIPHIYSYMSEYPEGFNLHPHPKDISRALYSLIKSFDWSRFIFLYESGGFHIYLKMYHYYNLRYFHSGVLEYFE